MEHSYKGYEALNAFLHSARTDKRLTSVHICLYCVLVRFWLKNECKNPVAITRKKVMGFAKVSVATYHRVIGDLHTHGYIDYCPSFNPATGSFVYLTPVELKR